MEDEFIRGAAGGWWRQLNGTRRAGGTDGPAPLTSTDIFMKVTGYGAGLQILGSNWGGRGRNRRRLGGRAEPPQLAARLGSSGPDWAARLSTVGSSTQDWTSHS